MLDMTTNELGPSYLLSLAVEFPYKMRFVRSSVQTIETAVSQKKCGTSANEIEQLRNSLQLYHTTFFTISASSSV